VASKKDSKNRTLILKSQNIKLYLRSTKVSCFQSQTDSTSIPSLVDGNYTMLVFQFAFCVESLVKVYTTVLNGEN